LRNLGTERYTAGEREAADGKAYQRYQRLSIKRQIADEQSMAVQIYPGAGFDRRMWGPWNIGGPKDYCMGW
jgi:hypothetical protein